MNSRAQIRLLPDGRRLHMNDGPIDLVIEAFGAPGEIRAAYDAAAARFVTILDELCGELRLLRSACSQDSDWPRGAIARRMMAAVMPYACEYFITPMASVAGAVAEEVLAAMLAATGLRRAYVNNGGDIAFHMARNETLTVGLIDRPDRPSLFGTTTLHGSNPVRGIATSGWRGRSFSLGIADAVSVLADRAAAADAAATIIANAIDLPKHPAITRVPACELAPDSDLGARPVTQAVGPLSISDVHCALSAGQGTARKLLRLGLIRAAALNLNGEVRVVGLESLPCIRTAVDERTLLHA